MLSITLLKTTGFLLDENQVNFLLRAFILGAITFSVFFLVLKTMERHYTKQSIIRIIHERWEKLLYGDTLILIKNGVLHLDKLGIADITTQQVFEALRKQGVYNISSVKRLTLNADNEFCVKAYNASPTSIPGTLVGTISNSNELGTTIKSFSMKGN